MKRIHRKLINIRCRAQVKKRILQIICWKSLLKLHKLPSTLSGLKPDGESAPCRRPAASALQTRPRMIPPLKQGPKRQRPNTPTTPTTSRTRGWDDAEPPDSPTPPGKPMGPKPRAVPQNIRGKMVNELLVAQEAVAQKARVNAIAAADMLDKIEEALDHMEKEGLT
ncbi:hypothetical protein VTO42DRAFT_2806 [Malbranchea cinnamomea]